jgi:hypothetical protein
LAGARVPKQARPKIGGEKHMRGAVCQGKAVMAFSASAASRCAHAQQRRSERRPSAPCKKSHGCHAHGDASRAGWWVNACPFLDSLPECETRFQAVAVLLRLTRTKEGNSVKEDIVKIGFGSLG